MISSNLSLLKPSSICLRIIPLGLIIKYVGNPYIPYFAPTEGGYVGIGIRKNDNDLKSKINNAISDAVNEGIIKKISMQWFQEDFTP